MANKSRASGRESGGTPKISEKPQNLGTNLRVKKGKGSDEKQEDLLRVIKLKVTDLLCGPFFSI